PTTYHLPPTTYHLPPTTYRFPHPALPTMPRISDNLRLKLIEALKAFKPAAVYLFGSFGTPSQHQGSDIDVAFLPTVASNPIDCFRIAGQLSEQIGTQVDLVNLTQASTVFSKEVLRTGILIDIASPALQQQFEMLTLSDYARLNEERKAILAS
ncbi:MAG: nucleotidyltransferase domain-containing protein, partial [Akkermansiaceae bacterium]|nr:nucleotidyltransferase domain-containing protein [Akkermansiaceae bacterium]